MPELRVGQITVATSSDAIQLQKEGTNRSDPLYSKKLRGRSHERYVVQCRGLYN